MADKLKKKAATPVLSKLSTQRDRDDALRLQAAGTHGDTVLAHINPAEARLLDQLADGLLDGGGRNPTTGLLSFGMSDGEAGGFGGSSGQDSNPGGVGGGPAGGQTGGGIGGNTDGGTGGRGGGYGDSYDMGPYGYAPEDTFMRAIQEYFDPSPVAASAPGRYGAPTAAGPGIMGTALGMLAGNPMSAMMGIGAAMGRAQSPAQQAASMAHNQALGSQNSTGQDRDSSTGLSFAELSARNVPGAASGSSTAGLLGEQIGGGGGTAPGGVPTVQPGGLMATDERERTLTGLPVPIQNILADYIWRGRSGGGFGW